jgi:hypothetical protein
MNPFDIASQARNVIWTPALLEAERELQEESDRGVQAIAICVLLALFFLAGIAGWLL